MRYVFVLFMLTFYLDAEMISNSIGMQFVKIPSGSFMLGTSKSVSGLRYVVKTETPRIKKNVEAFYLSTTEVTQEQYRKVMGNNPSYFNTEKIGYESKNNPVDSVNYMDAQKFVEILNKKEGTESYYLPSEVEWEYAARAGSETNYCYGNDKERLTSYAWFYKNNTGATHPVAQKKPNRWGLYDMHGNIKEWTRSCYTKSYNTPCRPNEKSKILRGGSWNAGAYYVRSANRDADRVYHRGKSYGFRVAKKIVK